MDPYEQRLVRFMHDQGIRGEHLHFEQPCHSVEQAANAAQASPEDFVKNICLVDAQGNLIVAIVKGEDRASTSRVGKVLSIEAPRTATPEEILEKSGYPCGGTPSFGYEATFLVDPRVMDKEVVYTGGGSEYSLLRISTQELHKANQGQIVRVRK